LKTNLFPALLLLVALQLAIADDFKTVEGKEYKNVTVSRVEPDGIVITFSGGIVKLPFTELPPEIQKKYGYDPKAAADFRQKSAADQRALYLETQQAEERADAVRADQVASSQDEKQVRHADRAAESLLIYAIVKPYRFSPTSTHARIQLCYRSEVGSHSEGLNVIHDYGWKPNEFAKPFNAVVDESMPQEIQQGDAIPVALYRIGHSDDSARLPRFTLLREKAIKFILTGSPR